jgi:hypothetical protein
MVPLGVYYMTNSHKEPWKHMGKSCGNFDAMKDWT